MGSGRREEREYEARDPDAILTPGDEWLEKLAWFMDQAIPLGPYRIGFDAIIGLVPGVGDLIGGMISSFIILHASRVGLPRATVLRMVANVAIDSLLGSVPFFGDVFDAAWKANTKNLKLFRAAARGRRDTKRDWGFLFVLLVVLALLIVLPIFAIVWLVRAAR